MLAHCYLKSAAASGVQRKCSMSILRRSIFLCCSQVLYHPRHPHTLISGSMDGLLNVSDLSAGLDEDDAFKVDTDKPSRQSPGMCLVLALHAVFL